MKVENLSVRVQGKQVIDDLNFEFEHSGKLLVVGKNGSGKSTLIKTLAGIIKPSKGKIINEESVAYVPDSSEKYFVGISPKVYFNFLRKTAKNSSSFDKQLMELIRSFSFPEALLHRKIDSLSLGEQKKVMLIGSFLISPDIYLMDEPLSGLDHEAVTALFVMINKLIEAGKKFIIISHDDAELFSPVESILTI
ncbi:ATP-binding cassette domain-containing protein [Enterococcus sp. CWB-B31]|uniref:ATP-binding cassette domain-containing protein n=1 Tax=Enterococcus sp. CWB-B31 TaxID=2885159 RepID=UPI001E2D066D|nr:ATP-binding cassette domain-containing protein [Enterococcus sp. CWB-B31]MCB5954600.1 ATP-binding cassette domain-containing protein [Enterococcus sp. CWB-B31]